MGRSKKSKQPRRKPSQAQEQKSPSSAENISYYFLAAIGGLILIMLAVGLLAYFKVF